MNFREWFKKIEKIVFIDMDETIISRFQGIFSCPGSKSFLNKLRNDLKIDKIYVLSHAHTKDVHQTCKQLGFDEILDRAYSTRENPKFDLKDKKWVLVDNLEFGSHSLNSKFKLLGIEPNEEHFIKAPTYVHGDNNTNWNKIFNEIKLKLNKQNCD